jgi:hypothetical protein
MHGNSKKRGQIMTVSHLIEILHNLPPDARVIVQGYGSGFNNVTGAVIQPIVVNGNHRPPGLGGSINIPVDYGGDHEEPDNTHFESEVIEKAVYFTSTRKQ